MTGDPAAGRATRAAAGDGPPALEVAGVSHAFGGVPALSEVSFSVPRGAFAALLGVNGAGKTTLFSLITRLYDSTSGRIAVAGFDARRQPGEALARLGVVFQSRALDGDLTLAQNLAYHAALHGIGGRAARQRAAEVLAQVGLADRAGARVSALSGGQQRRAEIARALLHRPELLLLDEATAGLDVRSRAEVMALVRRLIAEEGVSALWATHVFDEVGPEDRVIVLHRGRVLADGRAGDLGPDLTGAFLAMTGGGPPRPAAESGASPEPRIPPEPAKSSALPSVASPHPRLSEPGSEPGRMAEPGAHPEAELSLVPPVDSEIPAPPVGTEGPEGGSRAVPVAVPEAAPSVSPPDGSRPGVPPATSPAGPRHGRGLRAGGGIAFAGIARRELLRFTRQRERFFAALVRPLVWLFIFAAGFRSVLGLSITPPYQTYVLYEEYVTPGLCGMILLFAGMQSSLSMVYDRETGAMRTLLVSPYPRWFLLGSKLLAAVLVACVQVYAFLLIAWAWGVEPPRWGYVAVLPALVLSGLMLGALGLLISSAIRQLENFAGVMNFVIFPMFFASTALYPLWRMRDSSVLLHDICAANPFSHAVELIRFALYLRFNPLAFAVVLGCTLAFFGATVFMYDPAKGLWRGRGGGRGGEA